MAKKTHRKYKNKLRKNTKTRRRTNIRRRTTTRKNYRQKRYSSAGGFTLKNPFKKPQQKYRWEPPPEDIQGTVGPSRIRVMPPIQNNYISDDIADDGYPMYKDNNTKARHIKKRLIEFINNKKVKNRDT